ncbi:MAG: hypothetical protein M1553_05065, partial [Firmicutes bacterium]|nr:hypothetical protein [Bacillota bacterium]
LVGGFDLLSRRLRTEPVDIPDMTFRDALSLYQLFSLHQFQGLVEQARPRRAFVFQNSFRHYEVSPDLQRLFIMGNK